MWGIIRVENEHTIVYSRENQTRKDQNGESVRDFRRSMSFSSADKKSFRSMNIGSGTYFEETWTARMMRAIPSGFQARPWLIYTESFLFTMVLGILSLKIYLDREI